MKKQVKPEEMIPEPWRRYARDAALAAAGIGATIILMKYAALIIDSGPLPVPSRMEIEKVQMNLNSFSEKVNSAIEETTVQLKAQGVEQQEFSARQRRDDVQRLANNARNLQGTIATAKAIYDMNPNDSNLKILDALTAQLLQVQGQLTETSTK